MSEQNTHDQKFKDDVSIGSGASESTNLNARGSENVKGAVDRASNYSVDIEYLDPSGNVVTTVQALASGSGARNFDEPAASNNINVVVNDEATASATADISLKLV